MTFGRNPDDIKVLFLVYPIAGGNGRRGAGQARSGWSSSPALHRARAGQHSTITDIDFSKYDLDQPLPRLTTNGEQGSLDKFAQWGSGKTLRQLAMERFERAGLGAGSRRLARHGRRAHGRGDGGRSAATAS